MRNPILAAFAVTACASIVSAAPTGEITAPEPGTCHGPSAVPVVVRDDFGGGSGPLARHYDPVGGIAKLTPGAGAPAQWFGLSLALDDDVIAVGAHGADDNGRDSGAVYVFRFDGARWRQEQRLTAEEFAEGGNFGGAVEIEGDLLAVGATGYPATDFSGRVYLYRFDGSGWEREGILTASDAQRAWRFGSSLSLQGNTLAVGASRADETGAAYVFVRDPTGWREQQKLTTAAVSRAAGLGRSISLDGDTVAVGAEFDDDRGTQAGSVHVFRHGPGGWTHEAELIGHAVTWFSRYGRSLSLEGDTLAVGSHPGLAGRNSGFVYIFERIGTVWTQRFRFRTTNGHQGDMYGAAGVRLGGGRLVVGAPRDNGLRRDSGTMHYYHRVPTGWFWDGKRLPWDGATGDNLGWAIDIRDGVIAFGASGNRGVYVDGKTPASHYELMGDYRVRVTAEDSLGRQVADEVDFSIDLRPPRVSLYRPYDELIVPSTIPFEQLFRSTDADTAAGGVLNERVLLDGCEVWNGDTYGNRDGLLFDEDLELKQSTLCDAILRCGLPGLSRPELRVEARDCGGNVGVATRPATIVPTVERADCETP